MRSFLDPKGFSPETNGANTEDAASGSVPSFLCFRTEVSRLASDSTSIENLLVLFPEIRRELDIAFKDALRRVARTGFYRSKERIIIAEAFFDRKPDIPENDRKELVALIKDAGDSKALKTHLKGWESSSTGGLSSTWFGLKPLLLPEGQAPGIVDGAVRRSRETSDHEFLAALPDKLFKEPLLEQLAQDVIVEAHGHFQEFLKHRLPHLYSRVYNIQQQKVYRQVELQANEQKQKGKASSRSDWFNEIKMAQGQANLGYISSCPHVCPTH